MSTSAPPVRSRLQTLIRPSFYVQMALAGAAILIISTLGCLLTSIHVPDAGTIALGLALALVVVLPLLLFLREKRMLYLRDSLLTTLWAFFFMFMLGYPVTVAARLVMSFFHLWVYWRHIPMDAGKELEGNTARQLCRQVAEHSLHAT